MLDMRAAPLVACVALAQVCCVATGGYIAFEKQLLPALLFALLAICAGKTFELMCLAFLNEKSASKGPEMERCRQQLWRALIEFGHETTWMAVLLMTLRLSAYLDRTAYLVLQADALVNIAVARMLVHVLPPLVIARSE
jgi:hypothetical protein